MTEKQIFELCFWTTLISLSYLFVSVPLSFIPYMNVKIWKFERCEWIGAMFALIMFCIFKLELIWIAR